MRGSWFGIDGLDNADDLSGFATFTWIWKGGIFAPIETNLT